MPLSPRQQRFVEEYCLDHIGAQAARRAGYAAGSDKALSVAAARLLGNIRVKAAIEEVMRTQRERLQIDADRVVLEFARIAFANIRDFVPRQGETLDLRRLNSDLTAALKNVEQEEAVNQRTGEISRHVSLKLFDKVSALNSLAKHLGLFGDKQALTGSIERRVAEMTREERLERVEQLRAEARSLVPVFERQQQLAQGRPTIAWNVTGRAGAANDNIATVVEPDDKLLLKRERHV